MITIDGSYGEGGGQVLRSSLAPVPALSRVDLMKRGDIVRQEAVALVSQLPRRVGDRELATLRDKLSWGDGAFEVQQVANPRGPGNVLMVTVASEHVTEVFTGFGERGVLAEQVAGSVVKPVREYLASGVPVGRYLADQLLLPMALAGGGEFMTLPLSRHATTNIEILKQFVDANISVTRIDRPVWHVKIESE